MRVGAVVGTRNKMNLMRKLLFFICLSFVSHFCLAQTDPMGVVKDLEGIHFRDTIAMMVFDSTTTRMYGWPSKDVRMVKYFKYIGDEPIIIVQAYTGDPHFICDFPREPLIKDHIYSFKICFSFHSRGGPFHKQMGLVIVTGKHS